MEGFKGKRIPQIHINKHLLDPDTSLPADVLWGSFVTHSFLWQTNPKGRLRGGYPDTWRHILLYKSIPFFPGTSSTTQKQHNRKLEPFFLSERPHVKERSFRCTWPWIGTTPQCLRLNKSCWPKIHCTVQKELWPWKREKIIPTTKKDVLQEIWMTQT